MLKDHVTLDSDTELGKSARKLPQSTKKKAHIWFTDGACNQQGTGAGICKYQRKIQWHISLGQDTIALRAVVATILDYVTSCLRKRLMKEQTTISTASRVAVAAALGASETKSLLVADCIEKL